METLIEQYLPVVLSSVLFFVVVAAVLKAALRPLGKIALGVGLLVLFGLVPGSAVQDMTVSLLTFLYSTVHQVFTSLVQI